MFFLKQKTDYSKSLIDKVVNNLNDLFDNILMFNCSRLQTGEHISNVF